MDGTIPTSKLPDVLRRIQEMSDSYGLKVANIFHAGDGNLLVGITPSMHK